MKLSDDFAKHGDANEGPLSQGDIGTLVEDDGSRKPYRVQSASGKTWWYKKEAIVKAEVHFQSCVSDLGVPKHRLRIACRDEKILHGCF